MHVEQGKTGVQTPSVRLKRTAACAGVPQVKCVPHTSAGTSFSYTDMLTALGEQKSSPMAKPETGVVAVLQMPANPVYTDEFPRDKVH